MDLRYEFYPAPGETVSLGAFYKHFRNPIEWTYIDMGGSLRYMYENADRAQSWGVELDVRKNLGFIGMPNLSLVLNAAWIYSNVTFVPGEVVSEPDRPMQGQSPYVINAGLYYSSERLGLDVALLYNRIGKRIVGLGKSNSVNPDPNTLIPDSYEMPRNVLDFSVSKRIGRRVTLSLFGEGPSLGGRGVQAVPEVREGRTDVPAGTGHPALQSRSERIADCLGKSCERYSTRQTIEKTPIFNRTEKDEKRTSRWPPWHVCSSRPLLP